ncbi:MAG: LLM class F420-dependent oxidoreductase [Pseudonocardiales bacterium]|nr:MAG: LLM class F420-dependent oxidoreductase [Pseudonocardiales bacterium]
MELAVHVTRFDFPGGPAATADGLKAVAESCEQAGVAALTLMDHYFQIPPMGDAEQPMLEGYTSLGFVAAHTSRLRLGLLVTGVTYRHPGLLAKIVTTLDVLSGGRAELGIGAAWFEREHRGLGVPYPSVSERFERLEETLRICLQMWSDDDGAFEGKHYQLGETLCSPQPLSRPHPRILIGGSGERKTLRMVAQYAGACNLFAQDSGTVAHKLDVLRRHCDDVGRDYVEIDKTIMYVGPALHEGDRQGFTRDMAEYAKLGVDEVHIVAPAGDEAAWISTHGSHVVEVLSGLGEA